MTLRERILAALKKQFAQLGLGDKTLEGVADMLVPTTEEDDAKIDAAVKGVEGLLKSFQSDTDTRVTTAVNKAKTEQPEPPKQAGANTEPAAPTDIAAIIAQALSPLTKDIADLKAGNITKTRQQQLEDKLKDANPQFKSRELKAFSRMQFATDDDFNTYLTELEGDMGEQKQAEVNDQLKGFGKPASGLAAAKENEVSPFMQTIVNDRAAAAKTAGAN